MAAESLSPRLEHNPFSYVTITRLPGPSMGLSALFTDPFRNKPLRSDVWPPPVENPVGSLEENVVNMIRDHAPHCEKVNYGPNVPNSVIIAVKEYFDAMMSSTDGLYKPVVSFARCRVVASVQRSATITVTEDADAKSLEIALDIRGGPQTMIRISTETDEETLCGWAFDVVSPLSAHDVREVVFVGNISDALVKSISRAFDCDIVRRAAEE